MMDKINIDLELQEQTHDEISIDLLTKNPNAAVVDPRLREYYCKLVSKQIEEKKS